MAGTNSGFQALSGSAAIGTSGKAVTIHGVNFVSGAPGLVILRNGTSASGTAIINQLGTAGVGTTFTYEPGIVFPAGCYADIDGNVSQATVWYEKV